MKVVLVTNDFPPRIGGIQTYLWNLYDRLSRSGVEVVVICRAHDGDRAFDASAPMRVIRTDQVIWPSPGLLRLVRAQARDADVIAIGGTLPMAEAITKIDRPILLHTHGFEIGWAKIPGASMLLRRIASRASLVTHITEWTGRALAPIIRDTPAVLVPTGVDLEVFPPDLEGVILRSRLGLGDRPAISFVSRLVRRKGADTLIEAMPLILAEIPDAALVIVGEGADEARVRRLASDSPASSAIHVVGGVPFAELADAYAAGDVFAMPCRTRWAGMEVEGLGLVYLEAQACARPAITGDSGGAPEAVIPHETGLTIAGGDPLAAAGAITPLLADRVRAREMGHAGRRFMEATFDWDLIADSLHGHLETIR